MSPAVDRIQPGRGRWTFTRSLLFTLAVLAGLTVIVAMTSRAWLQEVVAAKDLVIDEVGENLVAARSLDALVEKRASASFSYLLTGTEEFRTQAEAGRLRSRDLLAGLQSRAGGQPEVLRVLDRIEDAELAFHEAVSEVMDARAPAAAAQADNLLGDIETLADLEVRSRFEAEVAPRVARLRSRVEELYTSQVQRKMEARELSVARTEAVEFRLAASAALACLFAVWAAWALVRRLDGQVGEAVKQLEWAASELEAASERQVGFSTAQMSATQEALVTMAVLRTTADQISARATRVSELARDALASTTSGERGVEAGRESHQDVRARIDNVVGRMHELADKGRRVDGILELVRQLSEQTNLLAVNATLEAIGAGEPGARFRAVADEIQGLASRVSGSTREIQELVQEIEVAAEASVAVTGDGAAAVERTASQFEHFAEAFSRLAGLVEATAEAARDIEGSSSEQHSAVQSSGDAVEGVQAAAEQTQAVSQQVRSISARLSALAEGLVQIV